MTIKDFAVPAEAAVKKHKVVITRQDGTVTKGFFCTEAPADLNSLIRKSQSDFQKTLDRGYISEDETKLEVDWSQMKAVFFVSSFKGDSDRDSVRFYTSGPEVQSIWVEIGFRDGEVIEGCVRNSIQHLQEDGFFLYPSTPDSNNLLIYVNKAAILSYRVLGLQTLEDE